MKKAYPGKITLVLLIIGIAIFYSKNLQAQNIVTIPNPDGGNVQGAFVAYNNALYTVYVDELQKSHLAKWNGSTLTIIPNPDNGNGVDPENLSQPGNDGVVFNNKLCIRYQNQSGKYQIAQYDGNTLSLISNPDNGYGFNIFSVVPASPAILNGKLYIQYYNTQFMQKLAVFDGTSLQIVPTPGNLIEYAGAPIIFNNKLCMVWTTQDETTQLVVYDGSNFSMIANPGDGGQILATYSDIFFHPVIYHNKVYLTYSTAEGHAILAQFDGNNITQIPNPDGGAIMPIDPIIYNDKLYVSYLDTLSLPSGDVGTTYKLGEYDGANLKLIENPASSHLDPGYVPFLTYNNQLYCIYLVANNAQLFIQQGTYNGSGIDILPNPDAGHPSAGAAIVFHNKLYYGYETVQAYSHLAQSDGENITIIDNPDFGGYSGVPFIFRDTLFFVYSNGVYSQLAYLHIDASQPGTVCPHGNVLYISDKTGSSYQWQVDQGTGFTNILNSSIYSGATTDTLKLTNPPTSWYGYKFHCVVSGSVISASDTLKFTETWTGTSDHAWENVANWSCGVLPDNNTDVIINSSSVDLSSNTSCRSVTISTAALLTIKTGFSLTITGKDHQP